jgi:hypothetical protein
MEKHKQNFMEQMAVISYSETFMQQDLFCTE